jgi:hypothetical protein
MDIRGTKDDKRSDANKTRLPAQKGENTRISGQNRACKHSAEGSTVPPVHTGLHLNRILPPRGLHTCVHPVFNMWQMTILAAAWTSVAQTALPLRKYRHSRIQHYFLS